MQCDTATLIDETIQRLEELRGLLADDATVCRRAGMGADERHCAEAAAGIAQLLPRLERARLSQDVPYAAPRAMAMAARICVNCDD
jgi:hypothetical protein